MTLDDTMVYYGPPSSRYGAQRPPPMCPKCGSHRTEVIGLSADLKLKFVRCNACGYRSAVTNEADEDAVVTQARQLG